jgi:acyl-ACP thioesterase
VRATGWPSIGERLDIATWCGGTGSHWAERRTQLMAPSGAVIDVAAAWVHVDESTGRPARLPDWFLSTYGEAAQGRTVSARVRFSEPTDGADDWPWPVRWADLDVLGHVNNAATWEIVEEACRRHGVVPVESTLEYGAAIEPGDDVAVRSALDDGVLRVWVTVDAAVRAAAEVRG